MQKTANSYKKILKSGFNVTKALEKVKGLVLCGNKNIYRVNIVQL